MIKFLSVLFLFFAFVSATFKDEMEKKSNHVRYKVTIKRGLLKTFCLVLACIVLICR